MASKLFEKLSKGKQKPKVKKDEPKIYRYKSRTKIKG